MLKKSKGNRFHQQGFIFSTFPINFIICLTPYKRASTTGAFFIFKRKENIMGVRVVFPDMGKDPSIQLIEKTITENGTYDAITDGANGYSKVNVNVEGGGGSSDFSTAIVTTINNIGNSYPTGLSEVLEDDEFYEGFPSSVYELYIKGGTVTHNCVLYKGHAVATLDFGDNMSVSGNIEKIFDDDIVYLITGDCTITIAEKQS